MLCQNEDYDPFFGDETFNKFLVTHRNYKEPNNMLFGTTLKCGCKIPGIVKPVATIETLVGWGRSASWGGGIHWLLLLHSEQLYTAQ